MSNNKKINNCNKTVQKRKKKKRQITFSRVIGGECNYNINISSFDYYVQMK